MNYNDPDAFVRTDPRVFEDLKELKEQIANLYSNFAHLLHVITELRTELDLSKQHQPFVPIGERVWKYNPGPTCRPSETL